MKKPVVAHFWRVMVSRVHRTNSSRGVFSRGPYVAYVMTPWKESRAAAQARPAPRERNTSRPSR